MTRMLRAIVVALLCVMLVPLAAGAHEKRDVGNGYTMTVGFLDEPPIDEEPNGLDLRVMQGSDNKPVEGLADTLKGEVTAEGQTMPLTITAAFGKPGYYQANFIPTAAGAYRFRIYGTINGQPVDQSFTSGPNTFSDVQPRATLSFPAKVQPVSAVQASASSARDTARTAEMLGIAGLVVGALGLIVGGLGLAAARRATRPAERAVPAGQDAAARP